MTLPFRFVYELINSHEYIQYYEQLIHLMNAFD